MKVILCLSALYVLVASSSAANLVCYFDSWTVYRTGNGKFVPQNVDPNLCTHVLYAFVGLNSDGTVHVLDPWEAVNLNGISDLVNLKQQNRNLKVLLSMGGWNEGSYVYSAVSGNPTIRARFVQNVLAFIRQNGFDGFDLSWEYPGSRGGAPADINNYVLLLNELKAALGNLTLSVGVAGLVSAIDESYNVPSVSNAVDLINIMSYDYHGSYETVTGHASALYPSSLDTTPVQRQLNVNSTVHHWIEKGADRAKLNLGIVTYGRGFTLRDQTQIGLHAPIVGPSQAGPYTQQPGMLGFNEICEFDSTWQYIYDNEQEVAHIVRGDQWVGTEDTASVVLKAQLAKDLGLGGVAVWSLDTDDFTGVCGAGQYPLINKIKSALSN